MLLNVVAAPSTTTTQGVRLIVLLSEARRSLRHDETEWAFAPVLSLYFRNIKNKTKIC